MSTDANAEPCGKPRFHPQAKHAEEEPTMCTDPVDNARHAVRRVLEDHRREVATQGHGVQCRCGEWFQYPDVWQDHRADIAARVALDILAPHE